MVGRVPAYPGAGRQQEWLAATLGRGVEQGRDHPSLGLDCIGEARQGVIEGGVNRRIRGGGKGLQPLGVGQVATGRLDAGSGEPTGRGVGPCQPKHMVTRCAQLPGDAGADVAAGPCQEDLHGGRPVLRHVQ